MSFKGYSRALQPRGGLEQRCQWMCVQTLLVYARDSPGSQDLCRATFLQPGGAASASTAGSHLPSGSPRSWLSSWCFGEGSSLQRVPGHTGQRAAARPARLASVPARLFPADSRRNSRKGIGLGVWELASEPARRPVPQTPRRNPAVALRCVPWLL